MRRVVSYSNWIPTSSKKEMNSQSWSQLLPLNYHLQWPQQKSLFRSLQVSTVVKSWNTEKRSLISFSNVYIVGRCFPRVHSSQLGASCSGEWVYNIQRNISFSQNARDKKYECVEWKSNTNYWYLLITVSFKYFECWKASK